MLEREITQTAGVPAHRRKASAHPVPDAYRIVIDVRTGRASIEGLSGEKVVEAYYRFEKDEAAVAVTAVLNGFQPPRNLLRLDTPSG